MKQPVRRVPFAVSRTLLYNSRKCRTRVSLNHQTSHGQPDAHGTKERCMVHLTQVTPTENLAFKVGTSSALLDVLLFIHSRVNTCC